jgi:hypothetical protein
MTAGESIGTEPSARELRDLLDKQQMRESLLRFCRGADRLAAELMLEAFAPHATIKHGAFEGSIEDFVAESITRLKTSATSVWHAMPSTLIDLSEDRCSASSETYFTGYLGRHVDGADLIDVMGGRYLDRWSRVGSKMLIVDRLTTYDWSTVIDQGSHRYPRRTDLFEPGRWAPDDMVFRR